FTVIYIALAFQGYATSTIIEHYKKSKSLVNEKNSNYSLQKKLKIQFNDARALRALVASNKEPICLDELRRCAKRKADVLAEPPELSKTTREGIVKDFLA